MAIFDGNINVSAASGNPGTILLDPENVTVGEDSSETEGDNSEVSDTENSDDLETARQLAEEEKEATCVNNNNNNKRNK